MIDKFSKKYLAELFHYVGIGFVGGAMSHGFFTGERSFYMGGIGFILFIFGEILAKKDDTKLNYFKILFVGVAYSISIGMVNGGFQHFLESPERSLLIVPIGFIISIIIFKYKEKIEMKEFKKSLVLLIAFGVILTSSLFIAYKILPSDSYNQVGGHGHGVTDKGHNEEDKIINKESKIEDVKETIKEERVEKKVEEKNIESHHDDGHNDSH